MKNILKKYIFQTGHGKGLAKAEIVATSSYPAAPEQVITDEVEDGFVVEDFFENPITHLRRLGGVVRICEVLQSGPAAMPLNFAEWVTGALKTEFADYKGKMRFGLSMHPKHEGTLKKTLNTAKKNTKELGNVRYVNKDYQNLSSVQSWHEHLLEPGAIELHLFRSESKWYLAKTLAIQDFEWYSKRDFGRPAKNAKNGMFPPKLAQMLINLAQPQPGATVFDPFCGSGTVLMEALLMGHPAVGCDLEADQVSDAQKNLNWLREQREAGNLPTSKVSNTDATTLTSKQLPEAPFVVVSETWLGPRLTKLPTPDELHSIQTEVESLIDHFLGNFKTIIPEPITLVLTVPFHKEKNDRYFLPNLPEILKKHAEIVPLSDHERPSLFYERKDQTVGREIWKVLTR